MNELAYKQVVLPVGHPLVTKKTRVTVMHRLILFDAIGFGPHPCHWCGRALDWIPSEGVKKLWVDHVDMNRRNNDLSNLVPSCPGCNVHRERPEVPWPWVEVTGTRHRLRAEPRKCKTCGVEFLYAIRDKRPNRGQFCSMTCRASRPRKH